MSCMDYPVNTSIQLRAVLRALRQSRNLSQADIGSILGVNQKRVARIESAPGLTSFDQIAKIVTALGGRVVIQTDGGAQPSTARGNKKSVKNTQKGNW
jgi:HTH-type transcriptional regulator / antitoxin HipB